MKSGGREKSNVTEAYGHLHERVHNHPVNRGSHGVVEDGRAFSERGGEL